MVYLNFLDYKIQDYSLLYRGEQSENKEYRKEELRKRIIDFSNLIQKDLSRIQTFGLNSSSGFSFPVQMFHSNHPPEFFNFSLNLM